MSRSTSRNDKGNIFLIAVGISALIAIAVLATARVYKARLDASIRETLAVEQRFSGDTAAAAIDAWLSDPALSALVFNNHGRDPISPLGERPCPNPNASSPLTICWRIIPDADPDDGVDEGAESVVFSDSTLRGGEAQREAKDVIIEVAVGCYTDEWEDCQQIRTITRRYERSVSFQYQLHYDTNEVPPEAIDGPDGLPDDPGCLTDPPSPPPGASCDDLDPATMIVFNSEDALNGPVRTTLPRVAYCGSPEFYRVEVSGIAPDPPINPMVRAAADPDCPGEPSWQDMFGTPSLQDLIDNERIVFGGDLALPVLDASSYSPTLKCDIVDFEPPLDLAGDCPRAPEDGDRIASRSGSDIIIHELVLDGSVTVYASGDIIICGDIKAEKTNDAGGRPNVIALITEGDVVLDPSVDTTGQHPCRDTHPNPSIDLSTLHNLRLINVAVLAPEGAIYARNWHLRRNDRGGPTLTIEGSIAAKHLGLYGIPNPTTGSVDAGWAKAFTYPDDFWLARPPWWPGVTGNEWEPVGDFRPSTDASADRQTITIAPALTVRPTAITVEEGSPATASLRVNLATEPSEDVTVTIDGIIIGAGLAVAPRTLTFTTDNWHAPQTVQVDASGYDDPNSIDGLTTVTLTGYGGVYEGLTAEVAVTITDDDTAALVVSGDSVTVTEGGTATVGVSLATLPTDSVTVTVASADPAIATVSPPALTFTISDHTTAQTVTVTGTDINDETISVILSASGGGYDSLTATIGVTITDDDQPLFTAVDATRYVAARDGLLSSMSSGYAIGLYGTSDYVDEYRFNANFHRNAQSLNPTIPLGEDDPNTLPSPADPQALRDAIDALAIDAGLTRLMIDEAEGG